MALEDIGADKVDIVYEDCGVVDKTKATTAFHKLSSLDNVSVVMDVFATTAAAYAPNATRTKVPVLVLWDDNKALSSMGDYIFGFGFKTELAGEQMAHFAVDQLKARKVAIFKLNDHWSEIISEAFIQKFKSIGGSVVYSWQGDPTDVDLRTSILKARAAGADTFYGPMFMQSLSALILQSKSLGFNGNILVGDGFLDGDLDALKEKADGIFLTQAWFNNPDFQTRYETRFKRTTSPVNLTAVALGFDALKFIVFQAYSPNQITDGPSLRDRIAKGSISGVLGSFSFNRERNLGRKESILTIKDGKFALVEQ